jgi:hypothetical protein
MKTTTIVFLLIILTLANASIFEKLSSYFGKPVETQDDTSASSILSKHQQLSEFMEGLFNYFSLPKPTEIIDCFGELPSHVFLKIFKEKYKLLKDTNEKNTLSLEMDFKKIDAMRFSMQDTISCVSKTQDVTKLFDQLGIQDKDPESISRLFYIYYQARYETLLESFKPLIEDLESKRYSDAGYKYGKILSAAAGALSKEGSSYLALYALKSGIISGLDLDCPVDCIKCYNNETAETGIRFFKELVKAIVEGGWKDIETTGEKFWENKGRTIFGQFPESVFRCDMESEVTKKLNEKTGVVFGSEEFITLLRKYAREHNYTFYSYAKIMQHLLDNDDYILAGKTCGHFLESVGSNK